MPVVAGVDHGDVPVAVGLHLPGRLRRFGSPIASKHGVHGGPHLVAAQADILQQPVVQRVQLAQRHATCVYTLQGGKTAPHPSIDLSNGNHGRPRETLAPLQPDTVRW